MNVAIQVLTGAKGQIKYELADEVNKAIKSSGFCYRCIRSKL